MRTAAPPVTTGADRPRVPSTGVGLIGLTERVVLAGGEISSGADRAGRFALRVRLPWEHDEGEQREHA